jgi:hypothetical protein
MTWPPVPPHLRTPAHFIPRQETPVPSVSITTSPGVVVTLEADTLQDLATRLAATQAEHLTAVARHAATLAGNGTRTTTGNGHTCRHGERVHRSGKSARGDWSAWMCPTPKGTPDQCAPEWDER